MTDQYQVLRIEKLKSMSSITHSLMHAYRTQPTPNADPKKAHLNQFLKAKTFDDAHNSYKNELLTVGKIRKNAVLCIEVVVSASPEFFVGKTINEQNKYFNEAILFLKKEFGEDNFVVGGVHRDEKTPHFWGYFIPRVNGKLNSKKIIGGHAGRLAQLQTDFHKVVSSSFGLARGIPGTGRKHEELKDYMKKLEATERQVERLKSDLLAKNKEISNLRATLEFNRDVIEAKTRKIFGENIVFEDKTDKTKQHFDIANLPKPKM